MRRETTNAIRLAAMVALIISLGDFQAFAEMRDAGRIGSATLSAGSTSIKLVFVNGRQRVERPSTPGETFDMPQLTADRSTVGWTVYRMDGASYAYPEWLQFVQRGVRRRFVCDGGMPQAWRFEGDDKVVADCAFPHGQARGRRVLVAIKTARVLAIVDLFDDGVIRPGTPPWALSVP